MNRRTRLLTTAGRRLPRPDPPTPAYLRRVRSELPKPLAHVVLGSVSRGIELLDDVLPTTPYAVPVRVYRPRQAVGPLPLLVNLHGGGFVFGNLSGADWLCGQLADRVGAVVVSVDYRLAPEHPAPAPYEDAWAATSWLLDHAGRWGADPTRAVVVGESAGGNLAALVTLALRDRRRADPDAPGLVGQVLIYPSTDLTMTTGSALAMVDAPVLNKAAVDWYGRQYVPQGLPHSILPDDPRVSPLRAADHADLPPALVVAAGLDPLRDDALAYAAALDRAGVPVRTVLYPEAVHGFVSIPRFEPAAAQALDEAVAHAAAATIHP
ncbi:alpha/beta hydrolase [Microlunatus spumicola]|uniref:Alpha/beta hydrolase n=1 Tax=Microlunatus spumicola TaxID=81499 RepID=A0ABP6WRZ5_9ACTN